jgi:hypothetical protein
MGVAFLLRTALRAMLTAEHVGYFVNMRRWQDISDVLSKSSFASYPKPFALIQASKAFASTLRRPLKTKGGWPSGISERLQNC